MIVLGRDQTTELRLLVTAPSENNPEKSIPVKFRVTDIGLGEVASATDISFLRRIAEGFRMNRPSVRRSR